MNADVKHGYYIKIFVAGEEHNGVKIVEKSNWNGCGLICSRSAFLNLTKRSEPNKAGVYLLIGPGDADLPRIYIGEGDPVLPRLKGHQSNKDFWTSIVMFGSKDDTLNKAKIQHLEARLVELAEQAKRCVLDNGNVPNRPSLSESENAEAEGFLEEMLLCLPTLGVPVFDKPTDNKIKKALHLAMAVKGAKATGYETNDGFVVLKGSQAALTEAASVQEKAKSLRADLALKEILVKGEKHYTFENDYVFNSPSLAASVVAGNNSNGRETWKASNGKSLRQLQEEQVEEPVENADVN